MNRKERRAMASEMGKDKAKKIESTLDLMLLLDKCCVCEAPFDRKSREHAMTWTVEVFKEKKTVDLYCPDCKKVEIKVEQE